MYILVTGDIAATAAPLTQVAFKNFAPFSKCITKIDGTAIDDAEILDSAMLIYNLTEFSSNYSETTGSLWLYLKDETTDFNGNNENTDDFKYLRYFIKEIIR